MTRAIAAMFVTTLMFAYPAAAREFRHGGHPGFGPHRVFDRQGFFRDRGFFGRPDFFFGSGVLVAPYPTFEYPACAYPGYPYPYAAPCPVDLPPP